MRPQVDPSSVRNRYILVSLLWCVAALAVKPFFPYLDFAAFYATGIDKILSGTPLDLYAFVARPPHSDLANPLAHPPIWFFCLSPWYALGKLLHLDDFHNQSGMSYGQAWMLFVTLPLDLLLCRTIVRIAESGRRFAEPQRFVLFLCILLSPLLWLSSVRFQHNEAAMILCVLLAIAAGEKNRPGWSGLLWGLALGLKTTAVVPALVYFGWGLGRERRRSTALAGVVAACVFLVPLLPYLSLRREQITYALFGFERIRPVGGYVVWKLFAGGATLAAYGNALILLVSAGLGIVLARRPGASFLASGGAWALVLSQVALLLFGKAVYVWYALAVSCFLFLADARDGPRGRTIPVVPLLATCALWACQQADWVGADVSPAILLRSGAWALLLLGIGAVAVRGWMAGSLPPLQPAPGVSRSSPTAA